MMNGVINVYKPSGMTSFDVVKKIRSITNEKKVGHTGTLDPLATGVLPICIGKATKIIQYIQAKNKTYIAKLRLGVVTDTYDREGNITSNSHLDNITIDVLNNAIKKFIGNIKQVPPIYSALKLNGKRLYEYARNNIKVNIEPREVNIYNIDILNINLPYVDLKIRCSKGTYIRSLCYDIGNELKCGACLWELERIKVGQFEKSNSVELSILTKENYSDFISDIETILSNDYEAVYFEDRFDKLLRNGVKLKNKNIIGNLVDDKIYMVYCKNIFLGLGKKESNIFKIIKLLA